MSVWLVETRNVLDYTSSRAIYRDKPSMQELKLFVEKKHFPTKYETKTSFEGSIDSLLRFTSLHSAATIYVTVTPFPLLGEKL